MADQTIIHNLEGEQSGFSTLTFTFIIIIAAVLGTLIGFGGARMGGKSPTLSAVTQNNTEVAKTVGIQDKKTFKDQAEGVLKEGGFEDEGSFHLERPGGDSQTVYLSSTAVDLSQYVGKKVRVWGQTYNGQKTAWLMDVGLVEILQ